MTHVNEFGADRKVIATLHNPSRKHSTHAKVLADFDGVDLLAFVAKDRTGGTDFQVRQLGKTIDERLSQSIGKIVGVRFCASVLERQDGD